MWNCFDTEGPHTTNHAEGWHSDMTSFLGSSCMNIYAVLITKAKLSHLSLAQSIDR